MLWQIIICSLLGICAQPQVPSEIKPPPSSSGRASWAIVDNKGHMKGQRLHQKHKSASLTKAMLLVAYVNKYPQRQAWENQTLAAMVQISDNDAANTIFSRLGSEPVMQLANKVGMKNFNTNGHWANADLTAYDQALFWQQLPALINAKDRRWALNLFESVSEYQTWAQAKAAKDRGWRVWHKSGWRPEAGGYRFNQAARICKVGCIVMVYLSEDMPYGAAHDKAYRWGLRNIPVCHRHQLPIWFC